MFDTEIPQNIEDTYIRSEVFTGDRDVIALKLGFFRVENKEYTVSL